MGVFDAIRSLLGGSNSLRSKGGGGGGSWGPNDTQYKYHQPSREFAYSTPKQVEEQTKDLVKPSIVPAEVTMGESSNVDQSGFVQQPGGTSSTKDRNSDPGGATGTSSQDFNQTMQNYSEYLPFLNNSDVDDLFNRYVQDTQGGADELASDIVDRATKAAQAEYDAVMSALDTQKGEVKKLGEQQRTRVTNEAELAEEELESRSQTERENIEAQREEFSIESQRDRERLGQSFRDISMELQRMNRARGVQDSSFAAGQETELLRDFNEGLTKLTRENRKAVESFGKAIIETKNFYERKKNQLAEEVRQSKEDINTWVRQQINSIQAQQGKAQSQKFREINNALTQAQQFKYNVAQNIAQQRLAWGQWLEQTKMNYQMAVAEAARDSVASAGSAIESFKEQNEYIKIGLENGTISYVQGEDGQEYLYDFLKGAQISRVAPGTKEDFEDSRKLDKAATASLVYNRQNSSDPFGLYTGGGFGGNNNPQQNSGENDLLSKYLNIQ